jgi:hypothetical protein
MTMPADSNQTPTLMTVLIVGLEAAAFGILCAGLLLWSQQLNVSFIHVRSHLLARLIFLVVIGGVFGLSAAIVPAVSRIVAELRRRL